MKVDRFDFEQKIMSCWNVTTDIKDVSEAILQNDLTKEQITNVLLGIQLLYEFRFNNLIRLHEQFVHEDYQAKLNANQYTFPNTP